MSVTDSFMSSSDLDLWAMTGLSAPCMTENSQLDLLSIQDVNPDPGQEVEDGRGMVFFLSHLKSGLRCDSVC